MGIFVSIYLGFFVASFEMLIPLDFSVENNAGILFQNVEGFASTRVASNLRVDFRASLSRVLRC